MNYRTCHSTPVKRQRTVVEDLSEHAEVIDVFDLSSSTNGCPSPRDIFQIEDSQDIEVFDLSSSTDHSAALRDTFENEVEELSPNCSVEVIDSIVENSSSPSQNEEIDDVIEVFDLSSSQSDSFLDAHTELPVLLSTLEESVVETRNNNIGNDNEHFENNQELLDKAVDVSEHVSPTREHTSEDQFPRNTQKETNPNLRKDEEILWLLSITCCDEKCLRKLSIEDISCCEINLKRRSQTDRRNLLLDYLHSHSKVDDDGQYETEFIVKGKRICKEAWILIHDLKKETFRRINNKFKNGVLQVEHENSGVKKPSKKTMDCISWLEFFINCVGQHQPDKKTIHLPSCFSILSIYKRMVTENDGFGLSSVALSQFYNIFHQYFPHVLIPKENRFTKCTDCTKYKQQKEKTMDKKARQEIDALLKQHLDLVWQERRVYYLHRYKARRFPDKYLTSIDDAMDQKTTNIPRTRRKTKATCNLTTVGMHLVGCIFHSGQSSKGKDIFGSFDFYQWPHDPNLTASVLLKMIEKWSESHKLPPVLYLQLDNCVKENKNQFMLWLLAYLVEKKIFEKIRLNFLPVGHTHEDIDAFFGVLSKHLAQTDVYTVEDMFKAMEDCLTSIESIPFLLNEVYDIKGWLSPHAEELHDHTTPKCFKFTKNTEGKCVMHYRNYSHMEWEGPLIILKSCPEHKPSLVQPTLVKIEVEALKRDMPKYKDNYPLEAYNTWMQWIEKLDDMMTLPQEWNWPVQKLLNAQRIKPGVNDQAVPVNLQSLRDKETQETRQIYTGRYVPLRNRQNPVQTVEDFHQMLQVDSFVAVFLENWDKEPVIGKVLDITEDEFVIHYWKGTYRGKWEPQNVPRKRVPWTDTLPKDCCILSGFELTEEMKLQPSTKRYLSEEYIKLKAL